MPTWAAILVGVGSGLLSGLGGTFVTITHQRGAEIRTRMLVAAEDFIRAAEACRQSVRAARGDLNQRTLDAVRERYDDLVPTVTLIELLYGYSSKAGVRAKIVGASFVEVRDQLEKGPTGDDAVVSSEMDDFNESLTIFGEVAADHVRRGWLRRRLLSLASGVPALPKDA